MSEPLSDKPRKNRGAQTTETPPRTVKKRVVVTATKRPSIWTDPVTRFLGIVAAVIIVGALLTLVFALVGGVIDLSGAPQTMEQRQLDAASGGIGKNSTPDQWQAYVIAYINVKQYDKAAEAIKQMKAAKPDTLKGEQILFSEASLAYSKGETDKALKLYQEVVTKVRAAYENELQNGGDVQNWAMSEGIHQNYSDSLLQMSTIQIKRKEWKAALGNLDLYLVTNPTEAGVYVDRGNVKIELGDKEGAKADFNMALKFIPGYADALAGLKKVGE